MRKILMLVMVLPLLFAGCSKDDGDETRPASDVELYYQQEVAVSEDSYSGTVVNDGFIASYSDGKIKGLHVGKTTGRTSSNQTFNITVKSNVSAIKEISREWGASRESLINNSELGVFKKSTSSDGDVWGATSSDGKIIYMYSFTNGTLSGSSMIVHVSLADVVADYLKERFTMVNTISIFGAASGYDSDNIDKAKTVVGVTVMDASHYVIAFMPKK